ncbi:hypothetical protein FRC11_007295 [Ceratobasidium sp. 423]|nr:hypothetical protein FRC11_007295 [Ceratobasidium sp. 423]
MALINRTSEGWCLDVNLASNQFSHLYASCAWGPRLDQDVPGSTSTSRRVMPNLLFVVQSPWLLNHRDFKMFCERSMYRHYAKKDPKTGKVKPTELDYVDKLWATIYDDCVRGGTHYFVLTTYNEWAFGAFSRGWTTAWITPPKPHNAGSSTVPGPTILQSILFWMHSAQHFYFDSYGLARSPSFVEESGLPTPITPTSKHSRPPSLTPSESELDLASETDDNTLDKGWLDEMRTSVREIKDLKGAKKLGQAMSGSWVIPEIWEDMEPPKIPPKRAICIVEVDDDSSDAGQDGWYYKRQRPINDDYATNRRAPPPRPTRNPHGATNTASPPDISSTQANASLSSAGTDKTRVLPGGFPSNSGGASAWSPWFSESSPVKIFWSRTFMSVRSTLADAFHRILRSRGQGRQSLPVSPATAPVVSLPEPPPRRPVERTIRGPINPLPAFDLTDSFGEVQIRDENERPPGPIVLPQPQIPMSLPQTAVAIGGHTIELTRPRLLSGIRLDQPTDQSWPPPRQPFTPLLVHADSDSDATEIDPDAQLRPECGFRDSTPSVHANSIYEI